MPESLDTLERKIRRCTKCPLHESRTHAVPGWGDPHARIMFVGEAPGRREDETGMPFVGRAGALLDSLLAGIHLLREEVFVTSILKCRPPGNRLPSSCEIRACSPYLESQIATIDPLLVCSLGNTATRFFSLSTARGVPFSWGRRTILSTYHPAAALYNPRLLGTLRNDFSEMARLAETLK